MKRGFPRPLAYIDKTSSDPRSGRYSYGKKWDDRHYPHPYAARDHGVAQIDRGRNKQCVIFKLCMNCGEPVKEDVVGLILYNPKSKLNFHSTEWIHRESGPYHFKCLNQSVALCPHLATNKRFMAGSGEWKVVRPLILENLTYY